MIQAQFLIGCIRQIRLQTETGTATYAFSDSPHVLELTVSGNPTGTPIPCDVNNYCDAGAIVDFTFDGSETASQCIHREDISGVRIRQGGNEGWFIKSVYTTYITDCGRELPLTADTAFYKWVDGDSDASYLVQELTLV